MAKNKSEAPPANNRLGGQVGPVGADDHPLPAETPSAEEAARILGGDPPPEKPAKAPRRASTALQTAAHVERLLDALKAPERQRVLAWINDRYRSDTDPQDAHADHQP